MSNAGDFIIENGVLTKYIGPGGNVIVPTSITTIGVNAFHGNKDLESIILPEGLVDICMFAFYGCANLKSVNLPQSLESIDMLAFCGCHSIQELSIPGATFLGASTFSECSALKTLVLEEGRTFLGKSIFENCSSLENISIPDSIEDISTTAFKGCHAIRTLICPSKLYGKVFGDGAVQSYLSGDYELQNPLLSWVEKKIKKKPLKYFEQLPADSCDRAASKIIKICHPMSLQLIEQLMELAYGYSNVAASAMLVEYKNQMFSPEDITLIKADTEAKALGIKPKTVAEWKETYSFSKSGNEITIKKYKGAEESVVIPQEIGGTPVVLLGETAFRGNKTLKSVRIPGSIKTIGFGAFDSCKELIDLTIESGAERIGKVAFSECKMLQSVIIADSLIEIEAAAFQSCNKLAEIKLPASIKVIPHGLFSCCKALNHVELPEKLERIETLAFYRCTSLKSLYISQSVISIAADAFSDCKKLTIHAPAGSYAEQYAKENNIPFVAE